MTLVSFKEKNVSICILGISLEGQEENWWRWDKSDCNFCIAAPINPAVLAAYGIYPLTRGCWAPYGPLIQDTSLLQGQFQRSTALNHHCPCLPGLGYSGHLPTAEPSCRASIYFLFLGFIPFSDHTHACFAFSTSAASTEDAVSQQIMFQHPRTMMENSWNSRFYIVSLYSGKPLDSCII